MLRWTSLRRAIKIIKFPHSVASSSAPGAEIKPPQQPIKAEESDKERSSMVAAAFASLKELSLTTKRHASPVEAKIAEAANLEALLSVADDRVSKKLALKIVSKLADWAGMGKIKMSDFEGDPRYARICRVLGQSATSQDLTDLSVVLGVAADEQAAKLITSISLPQMIKVMNSLGVKGRRSTPLLRSLSFNIGRSTETLDLKQAADVFFACSALNYPDEVLLAKVTADVAVNLKKNKSPALISSIVTSVGRMKYRDAELLESLCDWVVENSSVCRVREYISLVLTLGSLNYVPERFSRIHQLMKPFLKEQEMANQLEWLDVVWSLVVLEKYDEELLTSVLNTKFITQLVTSNDDYHVATKVKLLNINAAAQQLGTSYEGPLLYKESTIYKVELLRSKEKQTFINCIKDSFSNLVDFSGHFKTDVNTDMGFLIDFEGRLNSNSQLIKVSDWSKEPGHKIAVMGRDYHDFCRGSIEDPHGKTALHHRLLENSDYTVIIIPFYDFNPRNKLMSRVQYLESKLKSCIAKS